MNAAKCTIENVIFGVYAENASRFMIYVVYTL